MTDKLEEVCFGRMSRALRGQVPVDLDDGDWFPCIIDLERPPVDD